MNKEISALEDEILSILANADYQDHPAYQALEKLWGITQQQCDRMEKITHISDCYQEMMMERERSLTERFDKHLRQLEKMTRISDRYQRILRQMNIELEQAALLDPLTELPNRRMMTKHLINEINHGNCVVAMVDVDYFKKVNDEYGHQVGDEVLVSLGKIMTEVLREPNHVGRWGGEEFLILFPNSTAEQALAQIETLCQKISSYTWNYHGKELSTSISVGLTCHRGDDSMDSLITRADNALYRAKSQGRNQVIMD